MAKTDLDSVDGIYRFGRSYPHGRPPHDLPVKVKARDYGEADASQQKVQDPEAMHGPGYDNDAGGWVRGMGKQSPHPAFDAGPSGSRYK